MGGLPAVTHGAGSWATVAASVRGASHIARDTENQDAFQELMLEDGTLLVAVADGAGSARLSHVGSRVAAEAAVASLAASLATAPECDWALAIDDAFASARRAVIEHAVESSGHADDCGEDFATTLLVAVAGDAAFVAAQRGDGTIIVRDRSSGLIYTATPPQNGDYANQTFFLTDRVGDRLIHVERLPPAESFAVMTDGLTGLAMNERDNAPHIPFFEPLERFASEADDRAVAAERLEKFLESERVCARTGDDKTLVIAVRRQD